MSKKCSCESDVRVCPVNYGVMGGSNCCCNLPTLVILILIILQFSKKRHSESCSSSSSGHKGNLIDNGILFIIALYYLSCCNPCKKQGMIY